MWGRPGLDSRPRLHGGRLCAGTTGGDVGMRGEGEHEKGQVSNLPPREGKYRYYVGEGEGRFVNRPYGGYQGDCAKTVGAVRLWKKVGG